jgi:hypothetical protein
MPPDSRNQSELNIPKDLLAEVQRHLPAQRREFHVEGWQSSLVARMFGFFGRGRSRD